MNRKRISKAGVIVFGACCIGFAVLLNQAWGANMNVGVNILFPPPYRIAAPPPTVVIPGTYVYAVADVNVDIFFFQGIWYRPYEGRWFRASSYNGPWRFVPSDRTPRDLLQLPHHDYRRIPPGYYRIPYSHLKTNWKGWEGNHHWERDAAWREGWQRHDERDHRGPGRNSGFEGRGWDRDKGAYGTGPNRFQGQAGQDRPREDHDRHQGR